MRPLTQNRQVLSERNGKKYDFKRRTFKSRFWWSSDL